jgi:hypothetical protein
MADSTFSQTTIEAGKAKPGTQKAVGCLGHAAKSDSTKLIAE